MEMNGESIITSLAALGEQLDYMGGPPLELVVCGGAALTVLQMVGRRFTNDVDVIALVNTNCKGSIELLSADTLPDDVLQAAGIVARDFDLDPDWLNTKAAQSGQSLPDGLSQRWFTKSYGKRLTIHFIGRYDQIFLKLHAVVDRDADSRHLADLLSLKPSVEEMTEAARWCLIQDAGEQFADLLRSCLRQIGYAHVANSIEDQFH